MQNSPTLPPAYLPPQMDPNQISPPFSAGMVPYNLDQTLAQLGPATLNLLDITMLVLCPILAALGTLVSFILKNRKEQRQIDNKNILLSLIASISEKLGHIFVGFVLGLVVALFFVGAIKPDITSVARVLAFSILLGFQAPFLWLSQEKIISSIVENKIKDLASRKSKGV